MKFITRSSEIILKGKNRPFFEKALRKAIVRAVPDVKLTRRGALFLGETALCEQELIKALNTVIGISSFSLVEEVPSDLEEIKNAACKIMCEKKGSFAVRVNRTDKSFPLTSQEIGREVGSAIFQSQEDALTIDLTNPEHELFIDVGQDTTLLYTRKWEGHSGLPVGTSGRVIALFSGGLDSVLAAYQMMRRGCQVDLVHFHNFADASKVKGTKVEELAQFIAQFQQETTLYLVPYPLYEIKAGGKINPKQDLVLFKHVMLRFADALAQEKGYGAIVTGDSLGQVASQTLENIQATRFGLFLPVFSPFIGSNKEEIAQLGRKLGIFSTAQKTYTDCCSLMAKNPDTKVGIDGIKRIVEKVDVEEILKSLKEKSETISF